MNDKTAQCGELHYRPNSQVPQCSCNIFHKEQNALIAVLNVELWDTGQVCGIGHSPRWEKGLTTRDFWPKGRTMGVYYHYFGKDESCYMYDWNALHFRPWIKYRNGCGDTCNINTCRIVNVDKFKCSGWIWKLHYRRKCKIALIFRPKRYIMLHSFKTSIHLCAVFDGWIDICTKDYL